MTEIINLGNGYGRVDGYPSPKSSLIFPFTLSQVRRLYHAGVLSSDELQLALLDMKYDEEQASLIVTISEAIERYERGETYGLGTV